MKAIVYHRYGDASELQESDRPNPSPKASEILLQVKACEVTKADTELRSFNFPVKWFAAPMRVAFGLFKPRNPVLGSYVSGTVLEVGPKVERFKPGDNVYGCTGFRFGGYGERLCLPEHYTLGLKPENLTHEESVSTLLGGLNAIHFLQLARLHTGDRLLVNGGGGSIGLMTIQLAKAKGAHVTAVDAEHKLDLLYQAGADEVIDYKKTPLSEITERYQFVFNMVADAAFEDLTALLNESGAYLTANPKLSDMWRCSRMNRKGKQRAHFEFATESLDDLEMLTKYLSDKSMKPIIDKVFPRHLVRAAHERVETEQRMGVVVLSHQS